MGADGERERRGLVPGSRRSHVAAPRVKGPTHAAGAAGAAAHVWHAPAGASRLRGQPAWSRALTSRARAFATRRALGRGSPRIPSTMVIPRLRLAGRGRPAAYVVAVVVIAGAALVRAALDPLLGDHLPYVTFFVAVAITGWLGGFAPAVFTAVIGLVAAVYLFVPPRGTMAIESTAHQLGAGLYVMVSGAIAGFAGAVHRAARDAMSRREQLHTTLASIGDAVIATDQDGRVTFLNPVAETLTGWSRGDALGRPLDDVFVIVDELTRAGVANPALRALRDGAIVGLANHTLLLRRDGVATPIDDSAAPIRDARGRTSGAVLVFRDVTERRRAETALRASEQRNVAIVQSANDALIVMDASGRIVDFNPAAERLFGWSGAEVLGSTVGETIVPERLREAHWQGLRRCLTTGEERVAGRRIEMPALRADGTEITVELSIRAVRGEGQRPFFTAFLRDVTERNRADDARAALAAIVVASDDAIVSKTLDGVVRSWNGGAERLFGWTAAEMIGRPITAIIPPELHGEERDLLERLRRGERVDHFETLRVAKSGRRVEVSVSISPMRDRDGVGGGAAKVARDIGAQKASARRLQHSEERYRRLVELLPVAVYTVDAGGLLTFHNAHAATLWGGAPDAGDHRLGFGGLLRAWTVDGVALPRDETPVATTLRDGRAFRNVEAVVERPDGFRITVLVNIDPIRDEHGAITGAIVAFHDTSALKRAQQALRDSEEAFRSLVAVVTDVPWSTDVSGAVVEPLPAWANYTGQAWEQYRGSGWLDAIHADDREYARHAWAAAAATGADYRSRYRLWHAASGQHRHVEARAARLFDGRGMVRGWIGSCTDVHEQTLAREELLLADRRKDEFLATLAHELRNPLAPVRNSLEIMRRARGEPALVEQARETMDRQVRLMERLMDDLLDVSRITRNRLELRRAPVELAAVLQQAVEACRPLCIAAGQRLSVRLPDEPVWLDADAVRLVQLFSNLLNNASKYSDRGGHIRLHAERSGDAVVVTVADDGIGIPAAMLPTIFGMFAQVERGLERSRGGLGIGLTLVKQLVELHGGSVVARSEGPGKGSEFAVRLPVAAPPSPSPSGGAPTAAAAGAGRRRYLVVDDNQDAATTLAMLLRLSGDEVHVAHDGDEALAVAAAHRPDIVLLDLGLPKRSGHDVCRALRAEPWGRELTIVALTGWGQTEDRRRSVEAGFDGHLVKPVDHAVLMQLLASARQGA